MLAKTKSLSASKLFLLTLAHVIPFNLVGLTLTLSAGVNGLIQLIPLRTDCYD